jgi:murein L,D-transpeptidase YcbB/YkuD
MVRISGLLSVLWMLVSAGPPMDLATAVRAELLDASNQTSRRLNADERADLMQLYRRSDFVPIWLDSTARPTPCAHEALTLIQSVDADGRDQDDYRAAELNHFADELVSSRLQTPSAAVRFDVELSADMLRYFRQLHQGRIDPATIGLHIGGPAHGHDFPDLLRSAIDGRRLASEASNLVPPFAQYRHLRVMLARYRSLGADPTLSALPDFPAVVRPGDVWTGAAALRDRLVAIGDLPADSVTSAVSYQESVVAGVQRFQERHGHAPDGVIGKTTQIALRVPLAWRLRQIEFALERLRWLPDLARQRLVVVNVPMFRLWTWDSIGESATPSLQMHVIVGRAFTTQTPVLVEEMQYLVFRPYWNVPTSILRHEILPKLIRDPDYLRREHMEIVEGSSDNARVAGTTAENLARLRAGALRLRQGPGPTNSLGLVKFVFPNDFDVYMHGTPSPALFKQARRDFSHGCVRVEDPVALAEWALRSEPNWTRDRVIAAMHGNDSVRVDLAAPIQVVVFYTTAVVTPDDGRMHFADDLYGHDRSLDAALRIASRQ